jgi:hypothetical protein
VDLKFHEKSHEDSFSHGLRRGFETGKRDVICG